MSAGRFDDLAVVLSGGGARAAYQVGVLAAMAERVPELRIPIITGVSAGAINAAFLAAHPGPFPKAVGELRGQWLRLTADQVYSLPARGMIASFLRMLRSTTRRITRREGRAVVRGLLDMRPLARFIQNCIDFDGIEENIKRGYLRALALSATSYATGQTVTFVQGAPDLVMWERAQRIAVRTKITLAHVMASSAIPIIFPAVRLDGTFYGDGSVRLTAPLAPAIHLGAGRIVAIAMRSNFISPRDVSTSGEYPSAAALGGLLLHSVFIDALDADVERLERVNRLLRALPPGTPPPDNLRPVDIAVVRPSRDLGALARGYWPRLPLLMDLFVRGIGMDQERGADFLSYLLFEPEYTGLLIELGREDALANWDTLGRLIEGKSAATEGVASGRGG
jgi:NTE family protein